MLYRKFHTDEGWIGEYKSSATGQKYRLGPYPREHDLDFWLGIATDVRAHNDEKFFHDIEIVGRNRVGQKTIDACREKEKQFSASYLRSRLEYDSIRSQLVWCSTGNVAWDAAHVNKLATRCVSDHKNAYRYIILDGVPLAAHRVIWCMVTGSWPREEIDHKNRLKYDNRWQNLREAVRLENCQNRPRGKRERRLGYRGIRIEGNGYVVKFTYDKIPRNFGWYKTAEEAAAVYDREITRLAGPFAVTNASERKKV